MDKRYRTVKERFWDKVEKSSGCWMWLGSKGSHGYGQTSNRGGYILAHRMSWELAYGTIPTGMCVLHKCDNRECVNPNHLFIGTKSDNTQDMMRKGRNYTGVRETKTHCKNGHEYSPENIYMHLRSDGKYRRECRACVLACQHRRNVIKRGPKLGPR